MTNGAYLAGVLVGIIVHLWLWPKWKVGQVIRQNRPVIGTNQSNRNED